MNTEIESLFSEGAKPYPVNSDIELRSRNTAQDLLNSTFVRGDIRALDKYPNFDGVLELTDSKGVPLGQINVQVKTLSVRSASNPGYSCDESFMAACEGSLLPVILLVVNNENRKVYWRHIDSQCMIQFLQQKVGHTYYVKTPLENCIDGENDAYISIWEKIISIRKQKIWGYDPLNNKLKERERQIDEFLGGLLPADNLDPIIITELQVFLDQVNFVLERQFPGIREILYQKYWKIGIALASSSPESYSFALVPIPYGKNEVMIKQVDLKKAKDLLSPYNPNPALMFVIDHERRRLKNSSLTFAHQLLRGEIFRISEKQHLPIEDAFVANEYIIGFIDTFINYLGFERDQPFYSTAELKNLLQFVLPVMEERGHSFREGLQEWDCSIDSNTRLTRSNNKRIEETRVVLAAGYAPKVKTTLFSQLFDFKILYYYISLLESKGLDVANRCYIVNREINVPGEERWRSWNRVILFENAKIFFTNFNRIYTGLLFNNFQGIKDDLSIKEQDLTIFVLKNGKMPSFRPYMERYTLQSSQPMDKRILFYREDDLDCPVNMDNHFKSGDYSCVVDNVSCTVKGMAVTTLDFLFTALPTYTMATRVLMEKLNKFFK